MNEITYGGITHAEMVAKLMKNPHEIVDMLTPERAMIIHNMIGIDSEGGEIIDIAKKLFIYGKEPDYTHVVEELGDLEFYMEGLRVAMGISRDQTIYANMKKLYKRYEDFNYSDTAAIARADKSKNDE